ncbi:carbonate dehydratase [Neobacillus sp. LXY-4]|uniref:carbonate dehydratase n=1 Tax=Neobacillus sp. LXY-4 TaxID=3379826 RepID=UPI003EE3F559
MQEKVHFKTMEKDNDCYQPFISANPITSFNKNQIYPNIDKTAYLSPFTSVIGDVTVSSNVFIAPNVSIRADEGTPFVIGSNTNIQDHVVFHGLLNKLISYAGKKYSIFVGNEVTIAHGALIHGPCFIGDRVFVGFNSIVYNALVGEGAFISINSVVTNGVRIAANRFVPPGAHIDTQEKADSLSQIPKENKAFSQEVQRVNQEFPASYHVHFGKKCCSCGIPYND